MFLFVSNPICVSSRSEHFTKSWDEEEEDWMYTNAVIGTIHNPAVPGGAGDYETIFHKYCYDTVTANSKQITMEHLIPGTPQGIKPKGQFASVDSGAGMKRALEVRVCVCFGCFGYRCGSVSYVSPLDGWEINRRKTRTMTKTSSG